ncbi:MAG: nickel-dependent lactate racemase, partial [Anaerovoracaceae bacterium]|nr:nickel-dependent lactate racemase [Anaerovoracaceae bacterium]
MRVGLGIGERVQYVDIDEKNYAGTLNQNNVEIGLTGEAEVRRALEEPVGSPRLRDIVEPGEKIAVITSDISRPCPSRLMLPALMDELGEAGVSDDDVTVVFGLGSHRHQTDDERRKLVGDTIYDRVKCIDSTPEDTVSFGATKRGTPVDISRAVAEADRRICLANIEYHYFAGYSGGAKSIMPGVSTPGAIQENHRSMVDPDAYTGHLEGNPVREDIEEAAAMVGADFILNVVLDEDKRIVKAVAGDMTEAHRTGCEFLDRLYAVGIGERADIVIVSQGGAPK